MDDGFLWVWSELVAAYYGKNGFGTDTAEIYAYHLTPYVPSLEHRRHEARAEMAAIAHRRLVELLTAFERVMDCIVLLDGLSLIEWGFATQQEGFSHRAQIQVKPKQ